MESNCLLAGTTIAALVSGALKCNADTELSVCTDQFALCDFRFGEIDYGACL